jgi:hypothetical protein
MNSQELRALQEAYNQVYEIDEELTGERKKRALEIIGKSKFVGPKDVLLSDIISGVEGSESNFKMRKTRAMPTKRGGGGIRGERKTGRGSAWNSDRGEGHKAKRRAAKLNKEQVDLYDIILSHLLDEGYADTQEQAEVIMVNMSEDWRESICEAMVDSGLTGQEKKKIRNERNFGTNTLSKSKSTKERHKKHREIRGMKKIKGDKTGEKESSILSQSSRVHKSYNNGYNRDGSYMG